MIAQDTMELEHGFSLIIKNTGKVLLTPHYLEENFQLEMITIFLKEVIDMKLLMMVGFTIKII